MINKFLQNYYSKLQIFCLLSILFLIFYRSPYILINGRFVAEEGSFFFKNAYENGILSGFLQIHYGSSYLNFWANICTTLATIPKLDYAPLVTVYLNLILIIFLVYFIFKSKSLILNNFLYKYLFSLLIIASPISAAEVWLNSINAQVYFGIFTVLIFFLDYSKIKKIHKFSYYILLLSGLTTLYSCILTPFFYIKYKIYKNKPDLRNFIILSICTTIQLSIFVYSKLNNLAYVGVRHEISSQKIISFYYNVIVKPVIGRENSHFIINTFKSIDSNTLMLIFTCFLFCLIFLAFKYFRKNKDTIFYFLIVFFITETILIFYGSHGHHAGGRYAVVPGAILLLILIRLSQKESKIIKYLSFLMITLSIISGLNEFKNKNSYKNFLMCNECPIWKDEIKIWKNNPEYKIKIWNYPHKTMYLNKI